MSESRIVADYTDDADPMGLVMVVGGNCLNCDLRDCGRNGELSEGGFTGFMGIYRIRSRGLELAISGRRSAVRKIDHKLKVCGTKRLIGKGYGTRGVPTTFNYGT